MDAWDKLETLLADRFGEADGEIALFGPLRNGVQIMITFAELDEIVREGRPDN